MTTPYRITGLRHVLDAATSTPWAILPEKLDALSEVLSLRTGETLNADEIAARTGKSIRHVFYRLQLAKLRQPARDAFLAGQGVCRCVHI